MKEKIISAYKSISPTQPLPLAGYADRSIVFESIASDLEINSICLKNADKEICLHAIDCLYVDRNIVDTDKQQFTGASHTHFAPALDTSKPTIGQPDQAYLNAVRKDLAGIFEQAKTSDSLHSIEYYTGKSALTVNRRRKVIHFRKNIFKWRSEIVNAPELLGKTSGDIHLVLFKNEEGKVMSLLWSFACHPTLWPKTQEVHSEYIGYVRKKMREKFGDIPVLFFQGFSGNISARNLSFKWTFKEFLIEIFHFPRSHRPFSMEEYCQWVDRLSDDVSHILEKTPIKAAPSFSMKKTTVPLSSFIEGQIPQLENLDIKIVCLSENILLIGFSAEPVVEFVDLLKTVFKNKMIIPVGCLNGSYGYLPTDKMVREGGYEGNSFFKIFGYNATFKKNIEKIIEDALKSLV